MAVVRFWGDHSFDPQRQGGDFCQQVRLHRHGHARVSCVTAGSSPRTTVTRPPYPTTAADMLGNPSPRGPQSRGSGTPGSRRIALVPPNRTDMVTRDIGAVQEWR